MFVVTEADAAAIRDIFEREGELLAVIEVRRRHCHVNSYQMMRSLEETYFGGYASYWAHVSDCQTLKALARIFRYARADIRCRRGWK